MTLLTDTRRRDPFAGPDGHSLTHLGFDSDLSSQDLWDIEAQGQRRPVSITDLPPQRKRFRPQVLLLIGRRDMGKTMAMTAYALAMQRRYRAQHFHFRVATNYDCRFAEIVHPLLVEEMMTYPAWGHELLLCIDEIQNYTHRRRFMKAMNVEFSQFLTVVRKTRCECLMTTQFPHQVDFDVLMQIDGFIECEQFNDGRAIRLFVHDYWGQYIADWGVKRDWPPRRWQADKTMYLYNTDSVWNLYDSEQLIASRNIKEETQERIIQRTWRGREIREWEEEPEPSFEERVKVHMATAQEEEVGVKNIDDLCAGLPEKFNVLGILSQAKEFDGNIKGIKDVCAMLEARGFKIYRSGATWMARREGGE